MFYRAFAASMTLLVGATLLLRFTYQHPPGMSVDRRACISPPRPSPPSATATSAFVRTTDVAAPVRHLLMFAGVTTTAILVAFVADLLLSRRIAQSAGRRKVRLPRRPRHRGRPRLIRHPRGQRPEGRRLRRGGDRARRRQPLPAHGRPPRRTGDLRRRHVAADAGIRAHRRGPCGRGADTRTTWSTSRSASCCTSMLGSR